MRDGTCLAGERAGQHPIRVSFPAHDAFATLDQEGRIGADALAQNLPEASQRLRIHDQRSHDTLPGAGRVPSGPQDAAGAVAPPARSRLSREPRSQPAYFARPFTMKVG